MRIARYVTDTDPQYGVVELASDGGRFPDSVLTLTGDPLAGPVKYSGERYAIEDVRFLAPVIPRSKVVGVGNNYAAHIAEMSGILPTQPLTFFKPNTSVIGPGEPIVYPRGSSNLHHEGELAVVIGRICRHVPAERVAEVIFGYTVGNDVTARDWQGTDGQWSRAKGSDTFCPLGPWIATHLSPTDVADLEITVTVNGEVRQQASTGLMLRGIPELIAHISSYTTLLPGDVILTGTPAGVGPIEPGDTVSVTIEEIGTLSNPVVAEDV